jgi:hypothetical protein
MRIAGEEAWVQEWQMSALVSADRDGARAQSRNYYNLRTPLYEVWKVEIEGSLSQSRISMPTRFKDLQEPRTRRVSSRNSGLGPRQGWDAVASESVEGRDHAGGRELSKGRLLCDASCNCR